MGSRSEFIVGLGVVGGVVGVCVVQVERMQGAAERRVWQTEGVMRCTRIDSRVEQRDGCCGGLRCSGSWQLRVEPSAFLASLSRSPMQ